MLAVEAGRCVQLLGELAQRVKLPTNLLHSGRGGDMDVAVNDFEDASLAFRDNKNPDLISSDVFENNVARLRELRIDR
ncbi:hypothetical protein D9M70_537000 [compost metagenome]